MPPVLYVTLYELPRSGSKKMFAHQSRFGVHERHHVLQLVAKSEGAA
jgi:hypothetical protein